MLLFAGYTPRRAGSSVPATCSRSPRPSNALGSTFERFTMLEGRAARPFEIREATASFLAAEKLGLEVGDTIRFHFFRADRFFATAGALAHPVRRAAQRPGP